MNISEKIKELRKQNNLSQEQLAEKMSVSRQAIIKWETNGGIPDIENIISLSKVFHISVDELLFDMKREEHSDSFINESVTEYDIDYAKAYDFNIGDAYEVIIQGSDSEKLKVKLSSSLIDRLESKFKVKLNEKKNRMDISIKNVGAGKTETKDALYVNILLPLKFLTGIEVSAITKAFKIHNIEVESLEFNGKVKVVKTSHFQGSLELNCSEDLEIICDGLSGRIDVNQVSSASAVHIPAGTDYTARTKGVSNKLVFTRDGEQREASLNEESENIIELNGMNSELKINEYTKMPEAGSKL